jgi:hypothetical protein
MMLCITIVYSCVSIKYYVCYNRELYRLFNDVDMGRICYKETK